MSVDGIPDVKCWRTEFLLGWTELCRKGDRLHVQGVGTHPSQLHPYSPKRTCTAMLSGTRDNYTWKEIILLHLGCMDIDYAIRKDKRTITDTGITIEKALYEEWERSNRLSHNNLKALLKAIDEQFVTSIKALVNTSIMKFSTLRFTDVSGVQEHIMQMRDIVTQLKTLEVEIYGDWILSTEAAPASIAKQISVPGDYQKISDAVHDGVPTGNNEWILIKVAPGVYTDTVTVPANKPYVIIQGGGKDNTILAWKSANKGLADAPLIVRASNFIAKDITFKNTYNLNEVAPAVAGFVQGDKCSFYQCNFLGVQDTLADYNGRHFFSSCYIEGTTDFIFGDGTSIYQV
eukprot:XP_019081854.1 PREDICTED: pectinesterase/pectinesterase inhibitor U1-like [Vitis vinifera]